MPFSFLPQELVGQELEDDNLQVGCVCTGMEFSHVASFSTAECGHCLSLSAMLWNLCMHTP